jgi:eukaryotic-like serine/threonine-protein kinase
VKNPVKFGKYYLLERISVGGMAEVFKAKAFGEAGFERLVALKRILPSIAEDQEFIAMFVDEAKLAVQLTHANIAQIFELGKVGEAYFIALEYVGGKDMRAIFERAKKRNETIPIPMACYMVMKLCEGLDYAHNKKDSAGRSLELVHRDVSPQNILVSYEGDVKLIDFGIAKAASKSSKTQAGILKGKFGYMSPEQVRGLQIDRRSDIFAVGICLYELLTTERLFVGESDFSTLEKVRNVEITPPTAYNKKVPEELENIVLKALAKHPEDRYRSAMDLHDDLQSFMYTSGNFFARKDLNGYMHKLFDEEIRKEQQRDDEFRKFDSRKAAESEVFENATPPLPQPATGAAAANRPPPPPTSQPPARSAPPLPRTASPRVSAIPAPPSRSHGPSAPASPGVAAGAAAVARQPTASMPVHMSQPLTAAAVPAPAVSAPPASQPSPEMDLGWDDDESATQIMDKPADLVAAVQTRQRPAVRMPTAAGPTVGAPRPTGQLPSLPALPQRAPATTALGIAPPPATSLQAVPPPQMPASAPPPSMSIPAAAAPIASVPVAQLSIPAPNSAPTSAAPGANPFNNMAPGFTIPAKNDAPRTNSGAPKADWPANAPSSPAPTQARKKDAKSTALLAFFGVIAVAALVVLALQLTGSPPVGTLVINTSEGAEVTVDGQPVSGSGPRFEVQGLPAGRAHHISVRKQGFESLEQDYTVVEGANALTLPLQTSPAVAALVPPPPPVDQQLAPAPVAQPLAVPPPAPAPTQQPLVQQPAALQPAPPTPAPPAPAVVAPPTPRPQIARTEPRPHTPEVPRPRSPRVATVVEPTPAPTPTPAPSGGTMGTLLLSTIPASQCTLPNGQTHSTPWRVQLAPGSYRIVCRNETLASNANYNVTIGAGETVRLLNRPLE